MTHSPYRPCLGALLATMVVATAACQPKAGVSGVKLVTPAASPVDRSVIIERLRPLAEVTYLSVASERARAHVVSNNGGGIVPAGGGNVVSTGGGAIVPAGGGNIVPAGAGTYRLAATEERPVGAAGEPLIAAVAKPGEPPATWVRYPDGSERRSIGYREVRTQPDGRPNMETLIEVRETFPAGGARRVHTHEKHLAYADEADRQGNLVLELDAERAMDEQGRPVLLDIGQLELRDDVSGWRIVAKRLTFDLEVGTGSFHFSYPELGLDEIGDFDHVRPHELPVIVYSEPIAKLGGSSVVKDLAGRVLYRKFVTYDLWFPKLHYEFAEGLALSLTWNDVRGRFEGDVTQAGKRVAAARLVRQPDGEGNPLGLSLVFDDGTRVATRLVGGRISFEPMPTATPEPSLVPVSSKTGPYERGDWEVVTTLGPNANLGFGHTATSFLLPLDRPKGLAFDADDMRLYVAQQGHGNEGNTLGYHDLKTGEFVYLAGNGERGSIDGTGLEARLGGPNGLVWDRWRHRVLMSEQGTHKIRAISRDGVATTIAGDGTAGFVDGPAGSARFNQPAGLAVTEDGTIFVADTENFRIRRITSDGQVSTWAGGGEAAIKDGPRAAARFVRPYALALAPAGELMVGDLASTQIRAVTDAGVKARYGELTDGILNADGPTVRLAPAVALAYDAQGYLYFATDPAPMVRRIAPDGTCVTLAGSGSLGSYDGPGTDAAFNAINGLAVHPAGTMVFASEAQPGAVRMLYPFTVPPIGP